MTIIKHGKKYTATSHFRGGGIEKTFTTEQEAREWLRSQYGLINLEITIQEVK